MLAKFPPETGPFKKIQDVAQAMLRGDIRTFAQVGDLQTDQQAYMANPPTALEREAKSFYLRHILSTEEPDRLP